MESTEERNDGLFRGVPIFSVEARAETVRSRAGIWIHLEKSIVDFLIREGVVKCSELGQGVGVEI